MNGNINRLLMAVGILLLAVAAALGIMNLREERTPEDAEQFAAAELMREIFPEATPTAAEETPSESEKPSEIRDAAEMLRPSRKPEALAEAQSPKESPEPSPGERAETLPETAEQPDFIINPDMEMPVIEMDGYDYIGVLEVPGRDLSLTVMANWSEEKLRVSPCLYEGSIYSGDAIIAGHNYARHFSPIKNMQPGEEVSFTDVDGNRFFYQVIKTETIGRRGVEEMRSGEWDLTLFTCTRGGGMRFALRLKLLDYACAPVENAKIGRGS